MDSPYKIILNFSHKRRASSPSWPSDAQRAFSGPLLEKATSKDHSRGGIYGNCFLVATVRLTIYLLNISKVSIDDKLIKTYTFKDSMCGN